MAINRATGPYRGGYGSNQCRHEGSREESLRNGGLLWSVCTALPEVSFTIKIFIVIQSARLQ